MNTMAKYKVSSSQSIWDIAIALYGTIEGAFDLFVSNPKLTMTTDLIPGMELEYHEDFVVNEGIVESLKSASITPANGERHVYFKQTDKPLRMICIMSEKEEIANFSVRGQGEMLIDWGDNSDLETIQLTDSLQKIEHYFNSTVDKRRLRIYGDFEIETLDASGFKGTMYPTRPVTVDEFRSHANSGLLTGLFLFKGTVKVDLRYSAIPTLEPIRDMSLQELDLRDVKFDDAGILDDYLEYLVSDHGTRRGCTVYLPSEPSERGMAAIQTLITDEEWNSQHPWKFIIGDKVYTYTQQ